MVLTSREILTILVMDTLSAVGGSLQLLSRKSYYKCRNKDVVGVAAQGPSVDISTLGQVGVRIRGGRHMY